MDGWAEGVSSPTIASALLQKSDREKDELTYLLFTCNKKNVIKMYICTTVVLESL